MLFRKKSKAFYQRRWVHSTSLETYEYGSLRRKPDIHVRTGLLGVTSTIALVRSVINSAHRSREGRNPFSGPVCKATGVIPSMRSVMLILRRENQIEFWCLTIVHELMIEIPDHKSVKLTYGLLEYQSPTRERELWPRRPSLRLP